MLPGSVGWDVAWRVICEAATGGEFRDARPLFIQVAILFARIPTLAQWHQEWPELVGVDWLEVFEVLVARIRWKFGVDVDRLIPGCRKTSEELAIEVCEQFILGEIPWTPARLPTTASVIALLATVVSNDVYDAAYIRKKGNGRRGRISRSRRFPSATYQPIRRIPSAF